MPDRRWRLMQDIESMRHLADVLEARASRIEGPRREVYDCIVGQLRVAAELVHELSRTEPRETTGPGGEMTR